MFLPREPAWYLEGPVFDSFKCHLGWIPGIQRVAQYPNIQTSLIRSPKKKGPTTCRGTFFFFSECRFTSVLKSPKNWCTKWEVYKAWTARWTEQLCPKVGKGSGWWGETEFLQVRNGLFFFCNSFSQVNWFTSPYWQMFPVQKTFRFVGETGMFFYSSFWVGPMRFFPSWIFGPVVPVGSLASKSLFKEATNGCRSGKPSQRFLPNELLVEKHHQENLFTAEKPQATIFEC